MARDEQGKPYTVRYEAVNAMLLNEFLKEHRKVEEQSSQIAEQDCKVQKLEATVAQLQSALKAQAAQIQKVSDQIGAEGGCTRAGAWPHHERGSFHTKKEIVLTRIEAEARNLRIK